MRTAQEDQRQSMQFFGARVNLAKALLYAINGGRDEMSGEQVADLGEPMSGDVQDYDDVRRRLDRTLDWLADTYVSALNVIHYMHDRYAYERLQMGLHDYPVHRTMACGIAGLSVAADSLSAIKHATVHPVRDESGLVVDYWWTGSSRRSATTTTPSTTSRPSWCARSWPSCAVARRTGTPSTRSRC